MSEQEQTQPNSASFPRWTASLILLGTLLVILSGSGLVILRSFPVSLPTVEQPAIKVRLPQVTPTPMNRALVSRLIVLPSVSDQSQFDPTNTPESTAPPAAPTPIPAPTLIPAPQPAAADVETISWTEEEKNALSWMCYYEVGGMGPVRGDACLSVISTVRARYVYGSGLGSDVLSVLRWPNQFNIPVTTDSSQSQMLTFVEQYQQGARGSCSGYFYFDSVPGGPSLCVIYGLANQFVEFHNGWR